MDQRSDFVAQLDRILRRLGSPLLQTGRLLGAMAWLAGSALGRLLASAVRSARRASGPASGLDRPRLAASPVEDGVTVVAGRDDDLASILGRIDAAEQIEIVLVAPRAARVLRRPGVWPRIAAHVRRRGITLRVLAARRDVRRHASASGLRASGALRDLRRPPRRRVLLAGRSIALPSLAPLATLRWIALLAAIAGAVGAGCYVVPSAVIVIVPPSQSLTRSATVRVDPAIDEADPARGVVPGIQVSRSVTAVVATPATATAQAGDQRATVELLIENDGDATVALPAGARAVSSSAVVFLLDKALSIPGGESRTAAATAEAAGTAGNVGAGELRAIAGAPPALTVSNPEAAAGGADVTVAAVAEGDLEAARALASTVLARSGGLELARSVQDAKVFVRTAVAGQAEESPLAQPGEIADALLVEYTATVSALAIRDDEAEAFAVALLVDALAEGEALLPGTVTVELGPSVTASGGAVSVELTATGLVAALFDPAEVRPDVTGARPSTAAARLTARLGLQTEPEITVRPQWVPWMWLPRRGSRIEIRLEGPAAAPVVAADAAADDDASSGD